jgi:hypothetical protein
MFKHKYLTMRLSPSAQGLQFHPRWSEDCLEPTECICTDGCSNCSGDCTGCSATCKGPDSTGAILVDREGEVEMVLDLVALQRIIKVLETSEAAR